MIGHTNEQTNSADKKGLPLSKRKVYLIMDNLSMVLLYLKCKTNSEIDG